MSTRFSERRRFLRHLFAGTAAATAGWMLPGRAAAGRITAPANEAPVRLGVASYSLRAFDRAEAIRMIQALRTPYVSVKSFHLPYDLAPAEMAAAAGAFREAGLQLVSGGNNTIEKDTDEHVQAFFDYAKAAGLPMLVIAPIPDALPRIERFVKAYDVKVAIHNHGPEDSYYPAPADALKLIRNMDPRVGLCVDVGHTARAGVDVVQAIADAGDRVLDLHMKDLRDLSDRESQCIVGEGAMPVREIFAQLARMNYPGTANLEYEIDEKNPLPGMKQSFAYMRGVLAGMAGG